MSREIKFRGWDKTSKMMVYSKELLGYVEYETNPVDTINIILNEDDYGFIFMQYTGIKDKNGKEIYEGDIIEFNPFMKYEIGVVDFSEGGFTANEWFLQSALTNGNEFDGKVIGNIYNNPELLSHE